MKNVLSQGVFVDGYQNFDGYFANITKEVPNFEPIIGNYYYDFLFCDTKELVGIPRIIFVDTNIILGIRTITLEGIVVNDKKRLKQVVNEIAPSHGWKKTTYDFEDDDI